MARYKKSKRIWKKCVKCSAEFSHKPTEKEEKKSDELCLFCKCKEVRVYKSKKYT